MPKTNLLNLKSLSVQLQCRLPSSFHRFPAAFSHETDNLSLTSYNLRLSHLLVVHHQLTNHVCCQHYRLPWLWLSCTAQGEEGQPEEDEDHRGDVQPEESSPDRKSSWLSHFCFFHRQSWEERCRLFGDHLSLVACPSNWVPASGSLASTRLAQTDVASWQVACKDQQNF